ncbi:embryo sac development arrest 6 [Euphorbia peplus]|nr:embryo sac development arrest 6 [Euphorbia peplus]
MSTQTMRAPPRRVSASNKRKEREGFDSLKPSPPIVKPKPLNQLGAGKLSENNISSNQQLLAGYLAHEYLTRGTLFGKSWEPDRAEAQILEPIKGAEEAEPSNEHFHQKRYMEVSGLLKIDGAHLPGIVNPRQLSSLFHM